MRVSLLRTEYQVWVSGHHQGLPRTDEKNELGNTILIKHLKYKSALFIFICQISQWFLIMAISASILTSAVAVVLNCYPECLGGWICVPSLVPRPIQNIGEKRVGLGMRLLCFPDVAEGSHCGGGVKLLSRMPWGDMHMVTNHTYSESTSSTIPTWSSHHADSSRWYSAKHLRLAEPHLQ